MGTVRKIGDDYYIEFYARGLRYQRNGGKDKAAAEQLLNDIEGQIQKGEMRIVVHDIEAGQFFEEVLELLRNEHNSKTFSRYASVIEHFREYCAAALPAGGKLSQVTPGIMEGYRAVLVRESSPAAANFTLVLLKDILDYAISLEHLNDNPALHTRPVEVPGHKVPRTFSEAQVVKVIADASGRIKDIVLFLLNTGVRVEELVRLKWPEVDFKENCVKIEPPYARTVPMNSETQTVLKRLGQKKENVFTGPDDRPLTKEALEQNCESLARRVGMDVSAFFNALRCTFARNVLTKNVSLVGLHKLLGLEDIEQVMVYQGFVERKMQIGDE